MPLRRQLGPDSTTLCKQIVALALLNVLTGWLGLKLAIPPGYVTAIFPPAGIALGALLRWGPRVWPGVFLGSIGLNMVVATMSTTGLSVSGLELAGIIACGSTLQAVVGSYCIEHWLRGAKWLRDGRKLVLMLLLGGPLACLIASSIGSIALVIIGKNTWVNWPFSMWSWWVGDTIGVILCAPTFLVVSQLNRANWRRQIAFIVLPSLVMLALVVQLFFQSNTWESQRVEAAFHSQASAIADDMRRDVDRYRDAVYAVRQLFKATGDVSPAAFQEFTHDLVVKYPGILALEYVDQVNAAQRDSYEKSIDAWGVPDFRIREFGPAGTMIPAGNRDQYYPIRYIEPLPEYRWLLGFDMGSETLRRTAFLQARDTQQTTATAAILLLKIHRKGLLELEPIYTTSPEDRSGADPAPRFNGIAMAVFQVDTMIRQAMPESVGKDVIVRVQDVTDPSHPDSLYLSGGTDASLYPGLSWTVPLGFANRHWQLQMSASESFVARQWSYVSWLVLAGGLLFTGILQMLLLSLTSHARNIEEEVEHRTHELADSKRRLCTALDEKETLLKEVYHRVKNNLQVITSLLHLEAGGLAEGTAKEALANTEARVRAMALVHEKLYQSGNLASVELADYVKELLEQLLYSGTGYHRNVMLGMDIAKAQIGLDSAVTLGLLLNELVANSLKHGFPDGRRGILKVSIRERGDVLVLSVEDDGVGIPPDFTIENSKSLGLKLAMSLAQQLGGKIKIQSGIGVTFSADIKLV